MDAFGPAEPPGRQPEPRERVGLDHIRRSAPGVPGAGDTLHRRDRWHSHFYRTAGGFRLEHLQQVAGGGPQRRLLWLFSTIECGANVRYIRGPVRVGLACWHVCDRTVRRRARQQLPALVPPKTFGRT